jgi:hypothetical protein
VAVGHDVQPSAAVAAGAQAGRDPDEFLELVLVDADRDQRGPFLRELAPAIGEHVAALAAAPELDLSCFSVQEAGVLLALLEKLLGHPDTDPTVRRVPDRLDLIGEAALVAEMQRSIAEGRSR